MHLSANKVTAWLVSCVNKPTRRQESRANDFLNAKSHAREKLSLLQGSLLYILDFKQGLSILHISPCHCTPDSSV